MTKIGVFDSGVGGRSVASAIHKALPGYEIIFRSDPDHFPYGSRTSDEIFQFVVPIFDEMILRGCRVIVVACNTVSTTLIEPLRERFDVPLIAMEPMIKPAAQLTVSGKIAVCATPGTLASQRYAWLKQTYAPHVAIFEPDCSNWARLIEQNQMSEARLREELEPALQAGADVIVLGCTHYHWIEEEIKHIANGRAQVLQPEGPVIAQLKRVLERLG